MVYPIRLSGVFSYPAWLREQRCPDNRGSTVFSLEQVIVVQRFVVIFPLKGLSNDVFRCVEYSTCCTFTYMCLC